MPHPDTHATDQELVALLDAELSGRQQRALETHLSACAACRSRAALLTKVATTVHAATRDVESRHFDAARMRLRARLDELAAQASPRRTYGLRSRHTLAAAAAVAAVAVLA
jgi:anti-sigma factor RsiW